MAQDDRLYSPEDMLYDLEEARDHRFRVYSYVNSYVTPYSSDTHGGELITEFNQRAAWNTVLKREVDLSEYADIVAAAVNSAFGKDEEIDPTTGAANRTGPGLNSFSESELHDKNNWKITSYATGTRDEDDFSLKLVDNNLKISSGVALVYGYYIDAASETTIAGVDAINTDDIVEVKDNPGQIPKSECRTKFIKLAVQYTSGEHARHDERLIPPVNGVYVGAVIVINDQLPYGNELLLGTITRDSMGRFMVTENPYKTRLIPLDSVSGAEDYDSLLSAVEDNHTYGIKFGSTDGSKEGKVTHLRDIDPWLWLDFSSKLAMLLRSMSTNSETAGRATDEPTRGIIVSDKIPYSANNPVVNDFNCLHRLDANARDEFSGISWHQAQVPAKTGADIIDYRALYLPYATSNVNGSLLAADIYKPSTDGSVRKPFYIEDDYPCLRGLTGMDGIMTKQQVAMLELMFDDYINRRSLGYARGKQFGPFLTLDDAKNWFERYKPSVDLGDYFWVINDTAEAGGTEATTSNPSVEVKNIVTNYGTVSGTVTGTAKQSKLEVKVTGTVTGTMDDDNNTPVEGEVNGDGQGTINATVTGTVTGTLDSFTQNVSSRYVCRYHKSGSDTSNDGMWRFAHAIMMGVEKASKTVSATGGKASGSVGESVIPGSVLIIPNGSNSTNIFDNKNGKLQTRTKSGGKETIKQVGEINYNTGAFSITEIHDGKAKIIYLKDKVDSYEVLEQKNESKSFQDTSSSKQSVLFAIEAVERGFAVPATATTYGVVKVGTGSELYDVINDPTTQRLRITEQLLSFIKNGGFEEDTRVEIPIQPNQDLTEFQYKYFSSGVVFIMSGKASEWRAAPDTTGTLAHLRGDITLDFTAVEEDGNRTDGFLLHLEDIDYITLLGDNRKTTKTHTSTETLLFDMNHCTVNSPFFTNIGRWRYSRFISGGNTLELELPWMLVTDVFTNTVENSMSCRFSSVTMGENGINSATLDIWIKHGGWKDYNGSIDRMWSSSGYIKYPPLFFEYDTDDEGVQLSQINPRTIQHIPDNLNMKISGTAGVHQSWDENSAEFIPSGNLLVNLDWEYNGNPSSSVTPGGKIYLNLYMKNSSVDVTKQDFSSLRFRANVQVIRLDNNSMADSVPYEQLYEKIPVKLS